METHSVKPPALFHAPWFQYETIRAGTREEIIAWLCWNDPNGVYLDQDSVAEGYATLTRDRASEIMQEQTERYKWINPINR